MSCQNLICNFCNCQCFFVNLGFSSHSRIFHTYGDVTITSEGLQIWTYAQYSWPLSSESSLIWQTYCDTGHPFMMFIPEDPQQSHLLPRVSQWSCHYLFLQLRNCRGSDSTIQLSTGEANALTDCAAAALYRALNMHIQVQIRRLLNIL